MKSFLVNPNILTAISLLEEKGYKAYIVGGAVRDFLSDLPISDYDISTNASLDEALMVFQDYKTKKYISKGITIGVRINHTYFELSTWKGNTLEEDLKNRDFSINSMAYHPVEGLIDPYNGLYDLASHTLRTVRDPRIVFKEDPLRILRAIRFSLALGLTIEEKTKEAMLSLRDELGRVAKERIEKEFDPILLSEAPSSYLREYIAIYAVLIPKLGKCYGFDQKCPKWHNLDILEHTLKVIDSTKCDRVLRYAALFHDLGKVDTFTIDEKGVGHFYGHAVKSADYAREVLTAYCYNHHFIDRVCRLIYYHDYPLLNTEKSLLKFLYTFGTEDIDLYFGLKRADILGQNPELYSRIYEIDEITKHIKALLDENKIITYKNLAIKGDTLIELGYQNEEIGLALDFILKQVIQKKLKNHPDKLYQYAAELKYHIKDLKE